MSVELWNEFRNVRRRKRAAQTEYAEKLLVRELATLQAQGHDPTQVVEQSVRSSWVDVWPIGHKRARGEPTPAQKRSAKWGEMFGGDRDERTITGELGGEVVPANDSDIRQHEDGDDVGRRLLKGRSDRGVE